MKKKIILALVAVGVAILVLMGFRFFSVVSDANATGSSKVKICHSTSSSSNPYVVNNPNKNGTVSGHDGHNGGVYPASNWGDIIPPFEWHTWSCPAGYSEYGNPTKCRKRICFIGCWWDYKNKIKTTHQYPGKNWTTEGQTIYRNDCKVPCPAEEKCPSRCHADTVYVSDGQCGRKECVSNAPAPERCPQECGYLGGTVPDGKCGETQCKPTNACSTIRWCFPCGEEIKLSTENGVHKYCARAIPKDEKPDVGFPWETGMDKYCEFPPAGECPTACGLEASEVDDGEGGVIQCPATNACEQPKDEPKSEPGPASAPQCTDGVPAKVPANPHVIRNGSQATVNAFIPEGDKMHVYFKENDTEGWVHAARDIPVVDGYASHVINDLNPDLGYTFGIQSANGCAGGETVLAVIVDPPANGKVFTLSFWEWLF